ncbi:hypothetical protein Tco_1144454 [Tanacetum coccineum]
MVVRAPSPYNIILGRSVMRQLGDIPCKNECLQVFQKREREPKEVTTHAPVENKSGKEEVEINSLYPHQKVIIGTNVPPKLKEGLQNIFAWSPSDMTGIPRELAEHKLNIHPRTFPVRQKKRVLVKERNEAINQEVIKLVEERILKEIRTARMAEEDVEKTAFHMEHRTCCHEKMPFGLRNAGATVVKGKYSSACSSYNHVADELEKSRKQEASMGNTLHLFTEENERLGYELSWVIHEAIPRMLMKAWGSRLFVGDKALIDLDPSMMEYDGENCAGRSRTKEAGPNERPNERSQTLSHYATSEGKAILRSPARMFALAYRRDHTRYCEFHNDHGHDTNDCIDLRKEIEACVKNGRLSHAKGAKTRNNHQNPSSTGASERAKRISWKQKIVEPKEANETLMTKMQWSPPRHQPGALPTSTNIACSSEDPILEHCNGEGPLVIKAYIGRCVIHRVYVGGGSSTEIMYKQTLFPTAEIMASDMAAWSYNHPIHPFRLRWEG